MGTRTFSSTLVPFYVWPPFTFISSWIFFLGYLFSYFRPCRSARKAKTSLLNLLNIENNLIWTSSCCISKSILLDDKEDEFPLDEFQLLSRSVSDGKEAKEDLRNDDEAKEDLGTQRAPRFLGRWLRFRGRGRRPGRRRGRGRGGRRCPTVRFPCSRMPNVCANMRNAIRLGKPRLLTRTTNRSQIRRNRRNSGCRSLGRRTGYNCDEYPFASSFQGGHGAVVRLVPIRENSIQGGILAAFYIRNRIGHGGCFRVSV